jgi:hypothetical protein
MRCSWTDAARLDWPLPKRCSWYMRYAFPGDSASYRDHTFLHKFTSLATENTSFSIRIAEMTSFGMSSILNGSNNDSLGSMLIVSPQFWQESRHSSFIRDWLPFVHRWLPLQHQVASYSAVCVPLVENPRAAGCC